MTVFAGRRRVLLVVGAFVLASTAVAVGYWTITVLLDPTNYAVALGDTLPAGALATTVATPAANSTTVALTFDTSAQTTSNRSISTYTIRRYPTGSSTVAATFTCTTPVSASTCQEASVPEGAWQYTDAATIQNWQGAESTKSTAIIVDTTPPTSTISFPTPSTFYGAAGWNAACSTAPFNTTNSICGTATDPGAHPSGVQQVNVSVESTSGATSGKYWGASSFDQASETKFAATFNAGNWTYTFPALNFPADGTYVVRSYATDVATNTQATATSSSFTIDLTKPTAAAPTANATTIYVNPTTHVTFVNNENVTLTNVTPTDPGTFASGVNSVTYYYCLASAGSCTSGTPWTQIGTAVTTSPYQVIWSPPAGDIAYQVVAVATDHAGNSSDPSTPTLVTVDTAGPIVPPPAVNGFSS